MLLSVLSYTVHARALRDVLATHLDNRAADGRPNRVHNGTDGALAGRLARPLHGRRDALGAQVVDRLGKITVHTLRRQRLLAVQDGRVGLRAQLLDHRHLRRRRPHRAAPPHDRAPNRALKQHDDSDGWSVYKTNKEVPRHLPLPYCVPAFQPTHSPLPGTHTPPYIPLHHQHPTPK